VKQYKYLGIQIDSKGSMQAARTHLYGVALKAVYKIKICLNNMHIGVKTALRIFDSLVSPIILYGCEITNMTDITKDMRKNNKTFFDKLLTWQQERLHLNFCRHILGVNTYSKTANVAILGELGRYPLFIKAMKLMWKYQQRCRDSKEGSLLQDAYTEFRSVMEVSKTWMDYAHFISNKAGVNNIEEEYSTVTAEASLKQTFRDYWKEKLFDDERKGEGGNKLRTYRKCKVVYELEPYFDQINIYRHRQAICKLRVSNHRLRI
jgi:hypothetical protein